MKTLFIVLAVMLAVSVSQAQIWGPKNFTQSGFRISGCCSTNVKYTPAFNVSDFENIAVTVRFKDTTNHTTFATDSVKFIPFWQRGYFGFTLAGAPCTTWHVAPWALDTVAMTAGKYNPAVYLPAINDSDIVGGIDTVGATGMATWTRSIAPYWSPIARVGIQCLAGTKKGAPIRLTVDLYQRKKVMVETKDFVPAQ